MARVTVWVLAVVALVAGSACSKTPYPPHNSVVFVVPESVKDSTKAAVEQFAADYPHQLKVVTSWDDVPEGWWPVDIQLVEGTEFKEGTICEDLYGLHDDATGVVWVCASESKERIARTIVHEMCHVFGSPGGTRFPHWDGGACGISMTGKLTDEELQKLKVIWNE